MGLKPGEFISDELAARNWSREKFAGLLDCSVEVVDQIIAGEKEITPEIAASIAKAFGTSAEVWLNLEAAGKE